MWQTILQWVTLTGEHGEALIRGSALELPWLVPRELDTLMITMTEADFADFNDPNTQYFDGDMSAKYLPNLSCLSRLRRLDMEGTELPDVLPDEYAQLTIEELVISDTFLASLPESFAALPSLEYLGLEYTGITALPPWIPVHWDAWCWNGEGEEEEEEAHHPWQGGIRASAGTAF